MDKIEAFKTFDGKIFRSKWLAKQHELKLEGEYLIEIYFPRKTYQQSEIVDIIFSHRYELARQLKDRLRA